MWESISPGITVRPCRSITRVPGPASARRSAERPTATIVPSRTASASCTDEARSSVTTLPSSRSVSTPCAPAPAGISSASRVSRSARPSRRAARCLMSSPRRGGSAAERLQRAGAGDREVLLRDTPAPAGTRHRHVPRADRGDDAAVLLHVPRGDVGAYLRLGGVGEGHALVGQVVRRADVALRLVDPAGERHAFVDRAVHRALAEAQEEGELIVLGEALLPCLRPARDVTPTDLVEPERIAGDVIENIQMVRRARGRS